MQRRTALALPHDLTSSHAEKDSAGASAHGGGGSLSAALSAALCMLNRTVPKTAAAPPLARILVVQSAKDEPTQYIACMNAIFSAQRLGVAVDGVCVTAAAPAFIEQVRASPDVLQRRHLIRNTQL